MSAVRVDSREIVVSSVHLRLPPKIGVTREPLETGDNQAFVVGETFGK